MNDLLHNEILLKKIFIGVFVVLLLVIVVLAYFAFSQDRTSKLDFDSVTINSDALPLTVPDYAGWVCNEFSIQDLEDSGEKILIHGEATYGDLKNRIQAILNDWRTRRPPQQLLEHYTNEKNRLVEMVAVFDDSKLNNIAADGSEYGLEVAASLSAINRRYNAQRSIITNNIPEEILQQLVDLGCYLY